MHHQGIESRDSEVTRSIIVNHKCVLTTSYCITKSPPSNRRRMLRHTQESDKEVFTSLCRYVSTLPGVESPATSHDNLRWLTNISKLVCEKLIEESTKSHRTREEDRVDTATTVSTVSEKLEAKVTEAEAVIARATEVMQRIQTATHRLKTLSAEVHDIYDDLTSTSEDVIEHPDTTQDTILAMTSAISATMDELSRYSSEE